MPSLFLPTHRDYNGEIRNDGPKTKKKSRCSNDGDFRLRGRRFWRDENDGDSVLMTESWQVCSCAYFGNHVLTTNSSTMDILAIVNVTTNSLCKHLGKCQLKTCSTNLVYLKCYVQLIHFQMFGQSLIHH